MTASFITAIRLKREAQKQDQTHTAPVSASSSRHMRRVSPLPQPRICWNLGGILLLIALWQGLALSTHKAIVASPLETWEALYALTISGELWSNLSITLGRLLLGLALSGMLGSSLGVIAGISDGCRALLEPIRWVSMALPAVFIAILGLLWFGMGDALVVFLVIVITGPVIYVNTLAGFDTLDPHLIEMGRIFHFSRWQMFTEIYLPSISLHVLAGFTIGIGLGVRAVVMAELLGASDGIGHSFNRAWTFLKTPELFAWMLTSLMLLALLEYGLMKPIRHLLNQWK